MRRFTSCALLLCLQGGLSTTECDDEYDSKTITISRMKIYTLCGADPGEVDVVFKMESDDDWKAWGMPASLSQSAEVNAVEDKNIMTTVNQEFVVWPAKYDGKTVDKMKIYVEEDDIISDDLLGKSNWVYYDQIPVDGSELKVSGDTTDSSCLESGTELDPSFDVYLTAACNISGAVTGAALPVLAFAASVLAAVALA